jgi:hypothetical protein
MFSFIFGNVLRILTPHSKATQLGKQLKKISKLSAHQELSSQAEQMCLTYAKMVHDAAHSNPIERVSTKESFPPESNDSSPRPPADEAMLEVEKSDKQESVKEREDVEVAKSLEEEKIDESKDQFQEKELNQHESEIEEKVPKEDDIVEPTNDNEAVRERDEKQTELLEDEKMEEDKVEEEKMALE